MKRFKQFHFEGLKRPEQSFGGSLLKSNPKTKRPLDSKQPILLTLRACKSCMRYPKAFGKVGGALERCAKKYGVRIYSFANVGNHLHILIKIPHRNAWAGFIRELTGEIASTMREIFGDGKLGSDGKFWRFRPHTRVVQGWKKAYQIAKDYVHLNFLEAQGFINRKETKNLKDLRAIFADP